MSRYRIMQWIPSLLIALSAFAMFAQDRVEAAVVGGLVAAVLSLRVWRGGRPRLIRPSTKKPIVIDRLRGPRG